MDKEKKVTLNIWVLNLHYTEEYSLNATIPSTLTVKLYYTSCVIKNRSVAGCHVKGIHEEYV